MIGMIAIVGLNSVNAQNMSTPETNMTGGTNATMGGNTTSSDNMTTPIWLHPVRRITNRIIQRTYYISVPFFIYYQLHDINKLRNQ